MKPTAILAYLCALVLCAGAAALAPNGGGDFDLSWHTIDGGGGISTGGDFELAGTIGQPETGVVMAGGDFELVGGFWIASANGPTCPADVNGDGVVDVLDLLEVIANWGACPGCASDVNGDGIVDVLDLLAVIAAWGPCA
jgi:hypothetical protein